MENNPFDRAGDDKDDDSSARSNRYRRSSYYLPPIQGLIFDARRAQEQVDRTTQKPETSDDEDDDSNDKTKKPTLKKAANQDASEAVEAKQKPVPEHVQGEHEDDEESAADEDDTAQPLPATIPSVEADTDVPQYEHADTGEAPESMSPDVQNTDDQISLPQAETAPVVQETAAAVPADMFEPTPNRQPVPENTEHTFTPPPGGVPELAVPERPLTIAPEAYAPAYPQDIWEAEAARMFTPPPPTERRPLNYDSGDGDAYPASTQLPTERYAARPAEYAPVVEARDRRLVPTVLTVVGLEYFARKRADRRLEKRINQMAERRHEDVLRTQRSLSESQQQMRREQQFQAQELQRTRNIQERFAQRPLTYGNERIVASQTHQVENANRPVQQEQLPQSASQERYVATDQMQQQYDVQPRQHVEQDAWRRYVVDSHGHEVTGAMVYGEAYHQERQQEVQRDRIASGTAGTAAADLGGVAVAGQQAPYGPGSGMAGPALPPGQPAHVDPQHQLRAKSPAPSNFTNPWFWLMLALIVAAFFVAATI